MRKVLTIAVAALLVVALVSAASATETSWRLKVKADDGAGGSPATGSQLGVYPTSVDGWDAQDGNTPYGGISADLPGTAMHVAALPTGATNLYLNNLKAPAAAKTWDVFVAANVSSAANAIRVQIATVGSTSLPTPSFGGQDLQYFFKMVENHGVAGAPANGTTWELPIPSAHSTTPYWTLPTNLPVIKLSEKSNTAMMDQAYHFQLEVAPVPEPSSMLALGSGLFGLAGYVIRRRRA